MSLFDGQASPPAIVRYVVFKVLAEVSGSQVSTQKAQIKK
jgi:hypothetical protein